MFLLVVVVVGTCLGVRGIRSVKYLIYCIFLLFIHVVVYINAQFLIHSTMKYKEIVQIRMIGEDDDTAFYIENKRLF